MNTEQKERIKLPIRLLYVEDEEDIRSATSLFLSRRVEELITATDGQEGLEFYDKYKPDLIVSDVRMPRMDGLSMASMIRQKDTRIPIIIVTAHSEKDYFVQAIDAGVNQFVIKPISTVKLYEAILKAYDYIQVQRELQQKTILLEEYRYAIDQGAIVSKTDNRGIITFVNDTFCEISGYEREELVGKPHNIVRHPDMPCEAFTDLWETIQHKEIWRGQVKNRRKDGGEYIVQSVIIPILDDLGNIKEYMSIRQDITMQVHLENELIKREKERLSELNRAKDSFLVVFSHELKTPLNAIINFSEFIAKEIDKTTLSNKEMLIDIANNVKNNGNDMLEIVRNILDLSRLKANKLEFNNTPFDLSKVVNEELDKYNSLSTGENIKIERLISPNIVITADMFRMRQIITNFISNAVKYGKGVIGVTAGVKDDMFVIVVEDNGEGIKNKDKIFDLFEQDETDDMTRKAKGTGVGLHFVKLLCESMNLQLVLDDSPKMGGARFRIKGRIG